VPTEVREERDDMSVEHQGKPSTEATDQYRIPDHLEHDERTDDFSERNENWLKTHWKGIVAVGAAAAAAVTAAGVFAFSGSQEGSSKEGQRPVASAPAKPGETVSASPAAPEVKSPSETEAKAWTDATRPYVIDTDGDGKLETYVGLDKAVEAIGLSVEDYPTAEAASKAIVDRLNGWVNFGTGPAAAAEYKNYHSETLPDSSGVVGVAAMGMDHVDDA
jgi:hypothetical protein